MPKVSVIVPVYGVENYIERCARSLFEQTLDDIEFIFIDDCSPDDSINILQNVIRDYPQRKTQIRIERMAYNSGLAAVRKYGVRLSTGDYVIACDSDDYVMKEMYNDMYNLAFSQDLDLVQCDIDVVNDNGILFTLSSKSNILTSNALKEAIIDGKIAASLCNKLVKREIYLNKEIIFPRYGMDEDNTMSTQLAYLSNKLGYIKKSYYKAYQNNTSISRIQGDDKVLKRFEESLSNSNMLIDFLLLHGYDDNSIAVINAKLRPKKVLWPLTDKADYIKLWKDTYPEINKIVLFDKRVPYKTRLKCLIVETKLSMCLMKFFV